MRIMNLLKSIGNGQKKVGPTQNLLDFLWEKVPNQHIPSGTVKSSITFRHEKKIYAPIYAKAVVKSAAFLRLEETYKSNKEMYLWDFDGYDYLKKGMNLQQVIDDPKEKMGHSFVLLMMLKREFHWPVEEELVTILSQTDELRKQAVSNAEESEKMKRIEIEQKRKERQNKRNNAELE